MGQFVIPMLKHYIVTQQQQRRQRRRQRQRVTEGTAIWPHRMGPTTTISAPRTAVRVGCVTCPTGATMFGKLERPSIRSPYDHNTMKPPQGAKTVEIQALISIIATCMHASRFACKELQHTIYMTQIWCR